MAMPIRYDSISLHLPFGLGDVTVKRSEEQARAAWSLYVELATRLAADPPDDSRGSAREALTAIHELIEVVRRVLQELGPRTVDGPESMGPLALQILQRGVQPFSTRWHVALSSFENRQRIAWFDQYGGDASPIIDESRWDKLDEFHTELEQWRRKMRRFLRALGEFVGIEKSDETKS